MLTDVVFKKTNLPFTRQKLKPFSCIFVIAIVDNLKKKSSNNILTDSTSTEQYLLHYQQPYGKIQSSRM